MKIADVAQKHFINGEDIEELEKQLGEESKWLEDQDKFLMNQ